MTSTRRVSLLTASLLATLGLLLSTAMPATADVTSATDALRSANLYVDDAAGAKLDRGAASDALSGQVKVAVLTSDAGNAGQLARQIGAALGSTVTVGVFVGHNFNAASNLLCTGQAGSLAARAVSDNRAQLQSSGDLTNTIKDFASLVNAAGPCTHGSGDTNSSSSASSDNGGSHNGWIALGVLAVLGAAGVGGAVAWRRRRDRMAIADARAAVQPFYDRLAADVSSLQPGDNATARQALADASERLTSGGSQLAGATRLAQVAGARRSLLEGLQAAQTARRALGLDPGPELPPIVASQAPQLTEAQQFTAAGQTVQGYPGYTPGAPYYFAGGGGYAGGWYSFPFWETLLIAEVLSPGWGGGWGWGGGGGFDGGYASGYDSGFDAGRDASQDGGNWGGGGDWGGGGGDWGGGGGDWGGGGGSDGGGSW
ncbi:MAG: hypothetical protein ACJ74U_11155 [Jatrophihabitantaceae bacterium]